MCKNTPRHTQLLLDTHTPIYASTNPTGFFSRLPRPSVPLFDALFGAIGGRTAITKCRPGPQRGGWRWRRWKSTGPLVIQLVRCYLTANTQQCRLCSGSRHGRNSIAGSQQPTAVPVHGKKTRQHETCHSREDLNRCFLTA